MTAWFVNGGRGEVLKYIANFVNKEIRRTANILIIVSINAILIAHNVSDVDLLLDRSIHFKLYGIDAVLNPSLLFITLSCAVLILTALLAFRALDPSRRPVFAALTAVSAQAYLSVVFLPFRSQEISTYLSLLAVAGLFLLFVLLMRRNQLNFIAKTSALCLVLVASSYMYFEVRVEGAASTRVSQLKFLPTLKRSLDISNQLVGDQTVPATTLSECATASGEVVTQTPASEDLRNRDFTNLVARGAKISSVNFSGSKLTNSNFSEATIFRSIFDKADLRFADFTNVNRSFQGKDMVPCNSFVNVSADHSNFTYSYAVYSNFRNSSLTNANYFGMTCLGCNFINSDLSGSNFDSAVFQSADLTSTKLVGISARGARFQAASLSGVDLSGAVITASRFQGAKLFNVSFRNAKLSTLYFESASLTNILLIGAMLEDIKFSGAKISSTHFGHANKVGLDVKNVGNIYVVNGSSDIMNFVEEGKREIVGSKEQYLTGWAQSAIDAGCENPVAGFGYFAAFSGSDMKDKAVIEAFRHMLDTWEKRGCRVKDAVFPDTWKTVMLAFRNGCSFDC